MAAGLVLLVVFVVIEGWFASAPLMPLRIYRSRTLSVANLVMLLIGGATFGMWFFVSLYLQQVLGFSPIHAGLTFLPMTLCIVAGSVFASRITARLGVRPLLVAGLLAQTVGLLLFAEIAVHGHYVSDMLVPSLLVAIGIGLSMVPATIAAVAGVAPQEAGLASGMINTARLFGGALGLAVLAALATSRTNHELRGVPQTPHAVHDALVSGFHVAFVVAAGFAFVGVLAAGLGLPRRLRLPEPAGEPKAVAAEA